MIDPSLIDVFLPPGQHDGYPDELAMEDTPDQLFAAAGDAARSFTDAMWIEPRDRIEIAKQNDHFKTWGFNYVGRMTHQGGSDECSTHALTRLAEAADNRQRGIIFPDGPKPDFRYEESKIAERWLSPLSIYIEAQPRIRGGSNIQHCLRIAQKRGFLPDKTQPGDKKYPHMLQGTAGGRASLNMSAGPWVPLRDLPDGWKDTAKNFRPKEVIIIEDWEQAL